MNIWQQPLTDHPIEETQAADLWLVGVKGRLDQDLTPQLEQNLTELLEQGRVNLVIDLSGVEYINSGGLRCLVSAWRRARQQNGNVALRGLSPRIQDIFNMVGFDKVFQIYN